MGQTDSKSRDGKQERNTTEQLTQQSPACRTWFNFIVCVCLRSVHEGDFGEEHAIFGLVPEPQVRPHRRDVHRQLPLHAGRLPHADRSARWVASDVTPSTSGCTWLPVAGIAAFWAKVVDLGFYKLTFKTEETLGPVGNYTACERCSYFFEDEHGKVLQTGKCVNRELHDCTEIRPKFSWRFITGT